MFIHTDNLAIIEFNRNLTEKIGVTQVFNNVDYPGQFDILFFLCYPLEKKEVVVKKLLVIVSVVFFAATCFGAPRYKMNPHTGKLEHTTESSTLQRNHFKGTWGYAEPDSRQRMNPTTQQFEKVPDHYQIKINPHTGKGQYADPKARLKYDPINKKWSY